MKFLYALSDIEIILLFGVFAGFACALIEIATHRFVPREQGKDIDLVMRAMTTTGAILTFVLAFSIVQAKSDLTRVQEVLNVEARSLGEVDRLLQSFSVDKTAEARDALAQYTRSVVVDEWPRLQDRSASPETGIYVRQLSQQILALEPQPGRQQAIFGELMRSAGAIQQRRDERINHAMNTRLPASFWTVIAILFAALGLTGGFLKPTPITLTMIAAQATMFGVLAAFLFILDEPFLGQTSASPQPFKQVYANLSQAAKAGPLLPHPPKPVD